MRVTKADIAQLDAHPVDMRRVLILFRPHRRALALVLVIIVISAALDLIPAFLTKHIIDDALPKHNVRELVLLVGGMLSVTVVTEALGIVQTWLATRTGQRVMHALRTQLFGHLQRQPIAFFTRTRAGELHSRLTNDVKGMQSVVTDSATSVASNLTTVIGTVVAMAFLSWKLALISLFVLPPAVLMARRVARLRKAIKARSQATLADLQNQIEEGLSINGVLLSKTMGARAPIAERFNSGSAMLTELELQTQLAGRWRVGTMEIIFAVIPAAIYLAAGLPATNSGMTIGTLVAFTALQAALFKPLTGVLNVGIAVTASKALFSRIFEYLDLPVEIDDPQNPVAIDPQLIRGRINFRDVSLRHHGGHRDALSHVELEIPAGAHVGIVGSTGSGKSTLAALISRLYDPDTGRITIDDIDLRDMTLDAVSSLVGVVSQEPYLLHASIADNLRYAKPGATRLELISACKAAQVHTLIASLPESYETVVGARGHRFSGGEKQRIALARTILRNPVILVLDEATSALDNATERAVQEALDELSTGRTTVTIAHRLSTVREADCIVVLEAGRIVESGRHDELLARGGKYAELVLAQEAAALV